MVISIIILLIILIFLLPIPLKITLYRNKKYFHIKIFNIVLLSPEKGVLNDLLKKSNKKNSKTSFNENNRNKNILFKRKNKKLSLISLYHSIVNNRFKPWFKLNGKIDFALDDAAYTAIGYGLLCNLHPILYGILKQAFLVKKFKLEINPHFNEDKILNFTIYSIIYFNLAHAIYILYLIYNSFENVEEVAPI
ncbi:DUF2953 domain-containing protein [Clostridium septicum]|uniref:DUF2953 domain-containing protein n=1 Tax=Clostridium septicum TaxID=1504 RepID=A0A9N7PK97_CLOSE|nr:DUF2953 domain-containing protein [Clostridium septicum]AYE35666.1 DUF2953 domain-containing protein [Clostridium septicum]MDU1314510.1 DUF2953 domain-containing protein [Clostridium septicum]QAS61053.1 DUF2953 domain-containing protein [Clostridium septicum]UEC19666.1 DUF2953 domain-containing protein [Clostridium septicum]USS02273.1 DUF2953 domain-containing protein [Clostridium septicum]